MSTTKIQAAKQIKSTIGKLDKFLAKHGDLPLGDPTTETVTLCQETVEALVRAAHWPVIWSEMVSEPHYQAILGTGPDGEDSPGADKEFGADLQARIEKLKELMKACEFATRAKSGKTVSALAFALELDSCLLASKE